METHYYNQLLLNCLCSYPTYEEWKLNSVFQRFQAIFVLILPMRNGNVNEQAKNELYTYIVLILPMRNGNLSVLSMLLYLLVLILPMRNGNFVQ